MGLHRCARNPWETTRRVASVARAAGTAPAKPFACFRTCWIHLVTEETSMLLKKRQTAATRFAAIVGVAVGAVLIGSTAPVSAGQLTTSFGGSGVEASGKSVTLSCPAATFISVTQGSYGANCASTFPPVAVSLRPSHPNRRYRHDRRFGIRLRWSTELQLLHRPQCDRGSSFQLLQGIRS